VLRKEAGLDGLRFYDLRHTAITNLAEGQASDTTILDIAGHVSMRMLRHYSHVRKETKRKALDALATMDVKSVAGHTKEAEGQEPYVTVCVTVDDRGDAETAQVVDATGGADGTRTRDLRRDRPAF